MVQERVASGEDVFGPLLRKFLLNNTHRVTVEVLPDSKLGTEEEAAEKERLKAYQQSLAPDAVEATVQKTRELKERQVRRHNLCRQAQQERQSLQSCRDYNSAPGGIYRDLYQVSQSLVLAAGDARPSRGAVLHPQSTAGRHP